MPTAAGAAGKVRRRGGGGHGRLRLRGHPLRTCDERPRPADGGAGAIAGRLLTASTLSAIAQ